MIYESGLTASVPNDASKGKKSTPGLRATAKWEQRSVWHPSEDLRKMEHEADLVGDPSRSPVLPSSAVEGTLAPQSLNSSRWAWARVLSPASWGCFVITGNGSSLLQTGGGGRLLLGCGSWMGPCYYRLSHHQGDDDSLQKQRGGVGWGCCFLFAWCSSCTGNLQVALGPVLKRVAGFALIPPAEAYPLYPIYILPSLGLCQSSDLSLQKQKKRLSNVSLGISTEYLSSSEWHVKTWIGWLSLWRAGSAMQPGAQS